MKTDKNGVEKIYWPKNNIKIQQCDPNSQPVTSGPEKWHIVNDTVKRRNIATAEEANAKVLEMMRLVTESENDDDYPDDNSHRITRQNNHQPKQTVASVVPKFNVTTSNPLNSAITSSSNILAKSSPNQHDGNSTPLSSSRLLHMISNNSTPVSSRSSTPAFMNQPFSSFSPSQMTPFSPSTLMGNETFNAMQTSQAEIAAAEETIVTTDDTAASANSAIMIDAAGNQVPVFQRSDGVSVNFYSILYSVFMYNIDFFSIFLQSYVDSQGNLMHVTVVDSSPQITDDRDGTNFSNSSNSTNDEISSKQLLANQIILMDHIKATMDNQSIIIASQQTTVKELLDVKKVLSEVYNQVVQLQNSKSTPPSAIDVEMSTTFDKLVDETTLNAFEEQIQNPDCRSKLIERLIACIGRNHRDLSPRNIALQVDSKILDRKFWASTAWTGGRVKKEATANDQRKFSLASHAVFLSFFRDVIRNICGKPISDDDLVEFVKSRTRNSSYVPKSIRRTAARKRHRTAIGDDIEDNDADDPGVSNNHMEHPNEENQTNNP